MRGQSSSVKTFLYYHYFRIGSAFKKILAVVNKPDDSDLTYLLEAQGSPIKQFKAHSQYINVLKLKITHPKRRMERIKYNFN